MRTLVADGNFKQDHLAMKNDSDDVSLSDGLGFMVSRKTFNSYLASVPPSSKISDPTPTVRVLWIPEEQCSKITFVPDIKLS